MEMIPIAGGVLAVIGLTMMAVAGVMIARGNKRQVKVVIPTSSAGKMPPPPKSAGAAKPEPPPPPAPKAEPKQPEEKKPEPKKVEEKKAEPPKPPAPEKPAPPAPPPPEEGTIVQPISTAPIPEKGAEEPKADPRVSEEGTRIAMIPAPTPGGQDTPPPPDEPTEQHPVLPPEPESEARPEPEPEPKAPDVPDSAAEEAPQSTIAITPGDMNDFRTIVEQEAPKSYGILVGIAGGMEGREIAIDEEGFVIGRDQRTAQLVISDPRISKRHVWIGVRDGAVWAVDVGSTNGTYLNVPKKDRITEVKLNDGDVLILAEDAARFEYRKG